MQVSQCSNPLVLLLLSTNWSEMGYSSVNNKLNMLASLPSSLQMVTFTPIGTSRSKAEPLRFLQEKINAFHFSITPRNWRTLRVVVRAIIPGSARTLKQRTLKRGTPVDRLVYDVVVDWSADPEGICQYKCALKLNIHATHLLNDRKDSHAALIHYYTTAGSF